MKKIIIAVVALAAVGTMASCGSTKSAQSPAPSGMVEEVVPLSGPEYHSDADYYRAVQNAASSDRSMAQKKAMQNCRQEIAANVQADLELVIENYAKAQTTQYGEDLKSHYQELAYTVAQQRLQDVQVVGEKMYKEENGNYRYYVCLQIPKKSVEEAAAALLAQDEKLNLEFDLEMFKEVFNQKRAEFER